jgi:hypothetical protein
MSIIVEQIIVLNKRFIIQSSAITIEYNSKKRNLFYYYMHLNIFHYLFNSGKIL